jgi:hypothetical protein
MEDRACYKAGELRDSSSLYLVGLFFIRLALDYVAYVSCARLAATLTMFRLLTEPRPV